MTEPKSRVLVTGAGGFIGRHLTSDLVGKGHEVVALDLNLDTVRPLADSGHCELVEGDVADVEVLKRCLQDVDVVYHLAAAHLGASVPRSEFWRVNVDGLRQFLIESGNAGVRRFVHCSSVGVYGHVDNPPADEETPCYPDLPYEESKLEGEHVVMAAVQDGIVPAVILRPAWVYGSGCHRTEKLFRMIGKGRFVIAGDGTSMRHCVYVQDMVDAFQLATTPEAAIGQVMIIGDSQAVTIRELVDSIAELTGAARPKSVPLGLMSIAAAVAESTFRLFRREPPISRRTLKFFTANTAFDIGRARKLLGYEPRYDLKTGLAETYRQLVAS